MNQFLPWAGMAIVALALFFAVYAGVHQWRWHRRERALRDMINGADRLENEIRECRSRLQDAHAAVNVTPGLPSPGSADAQSAINVALRDLLAHRLWIRDHAASAAQSELDAAVAALTQARTQLSQQLQDLDQARHELDVAMREHAADNGN